MTLVLIPGPSRRCHPGGQPICGRKEGWNLWGMWPHTCRTGSNYDEWTKKAIAEWFRTGSDCTGSSYAEWTKRAIAQWVVPVCKAKRT